MTPSQLIEWLLNQALPTWASAGTDASGGGFFERIHMRGHGLEAPRRTRVVARQVYVFSAAARHGWLTDADARVEHGLHFLMERLRLPDGTFAASVRPDGTVVDGRFDLYEQAFALFALACASRGRPDRAALQVSARLLLDRLHERWAHPWLGFEEAVPRSLPLRSNPHMHLLEAALEWMEVSDGADRAVWTALANDLVTLCLTRLVDPRTGAVHEQFDADWRPLPGAPGALIEPGHQFEWAWLLMRWARAVDAPEALRVARRLLEIGETHGVDRSRGVAVNALGSGWSVDDPMAKVWPQTERVKAWQAAIETGTPEQRAVAPARVAEALQGLGRFIVPTSPGLWQEEMAPDGSFLPTDCRASSLYHIVCAIEQLPGATAGGSHRCAA